MRKKSLKIGAAALSLAMVVSIVPEIPFSEANAAASGTYKYNTDTTVKSYLNEGDNPFEAQVNQSWDTPDLVLSQPVRYKTSDGKVHDIESMLTNFDFIADPTAIDNSDVDGKLYVYGTTEGFSYENGKMVGNKYANHSLTILSTSDMVNWTDEGFMDSRNLTNEREDSDNKVQNSKFTTGNSWAPSGLKIDGDKDGKMEYYLFYTNGGSTGYVMADSPTGPWISPHDGALFDKSTPNCSDCNTCFDPAVLADDDGSAYVYFGGLTRTSGRACKVKFIEGTGAVERDGDPVKLPTYAMFEDNEINKFNGKYYYSYCSDFSSQTLTKGASICVYVSSDPLNVAFNPETRPKGEEKKAFTDEDGTYRHFLGTVLDNPSVLYGETYNNHHHMQEFKDHKYIFYHSTILSMKMHSKSNSYRNLHVDEIHVDEATDDISVTPSYEGASQIEDFDPYNDFDNNSKSINATTTSYSAGVKSTRDDDMVTAVADKSELNNGSPMVLDCINTGDWTKIQGVNFGELGAKKFSATVNAPSEDGAIEVFLDDPTDPENMVARVDLKNTDSQYETLSVDMPADKVNGKHDVFFVFRGDDFKVSAWKFYENVPDPTPTPIVTVTNAPATTVPATAVPAATVAPATAAPVIVASATPAPKAEVLKINKVTAKKKAAKVLVKTNKGATISVKVYKSLKLAKKGGKSGLVKSYTIKAAKNKTGSVSIKLKSKLRANQAVRITVSKSGSKAVIVNKKVK